MIKILFGVGIVTIVLLVLVLAIGMILGFFIVDMLEKVVFKKTRQPKIKIWRGKA